ncbi:MAG: NAD(P)H-dependent oxidoreductase subunit E, partial [Planctomycetaceae bacterium]|nr:NAD(P)H-dependent oxidoreductase subunit E [Planctomycetaceae bacterium]
MSNFLDQTIQTLGDRKDALIPLLQAIQAKYRYLPSDALEYVCRQTEITPTDILGVASFYDQFRYKPVGEHLIHVCTGTACHVKGASLVYDAFRNHLGLCGCEDTDAKGQFTVQKIACLGCCTLAPVVQIDRVSYGHLTVQQIGDVIDDFLSRENTAENATALSMKTGTEIGEVRIGLGSCCQAQGSAAVRDELQRVIRESGQAVHIKPVGCVGMCHQTPLLETVTKNGVSKFYAKVRPEDVRTILYRNFRPASWKKRTLLKMENWLARFWSDEFADPSQERRIELEQDPVRSFLEPQVNIAMGTSGRLNPTDLDEFLEAGGFAALKRAVLEMNAKEILRELEISGLRGRGGAGFPTFQKWKLVHDATDSQKYVVCNGDEGDPGAFMDRMLLESYPLRILEGMTIAAKTVGATQGYLYIRAEYPLAVERVRQAIALCEQNGFLGSNILGTNFSFELKVKEGAGAFVCGEETALLESIEGKRGMPRLRPPYPVHKGL